MFNVCRLLVMKMLHLIPFTGVSGYISRGKTTAFLDYKENKKLIDGNFIFATNAPKKLKK